MANTTKDHLGSNPGSKSCLTPYTYALRNCTLGLNQCDRSGMGKSLYVRRLAEKLKQRLKQTEVSHVTIPLHGPVITPETVLELFQGHLKKPSCCIYHIDISPSVSLQLLNYPCTHAMTSTYFLFTTDTVESGHHSVQLADSTVCMWQSGEGVALPPQPALCCGGHPAQLSKRQCSPTREKNLEYSWYTALSLLPKSQRGS